MKALKSTYVIIIMAVIVLSVCFMGCTEQVQPQAMSDAGVQKATVTVQVDADGHTNEQNNIIKKYALDNDPATIRYVYVISPMTNKVMLKMTMKGKVTSSGKRLTPNTVDGLAFESESYNVPYANIVSIGGHSFKTSEVEQDDGTYGSSAEYLYGFSMDGSMQQIYVGGSTVVVSTKPLTIQDGVLNMQYVDALGNPITT